MCRRAVYTMYTVLSRTRGPVWQMAVRQGPPSIAARSLLRRCCASAPEDLVPPSAIERCWSKTRMPLPEAQQTQLMYRGLYLQERAGALQHERHRKAAEFKIAIHCLTYPNLV